MSLTLFVMHKFILNRQPEAISNLFELVPANCTYVDMTKTMYILMKLQVLKSKKLYYKTRETKECKTMLSVLEIIT